MCPENILGHHLAPDTLSSDIPYLQGHLHITFKVTREATRYCHMSWDMALQKHLWHRSIVS